MNADVLGRGGEKIGVPIRIRIRWSYMQMKGIEAEAHEIELQNQVDHMILQIKIMKFRTKKMKNP